MRITFSSLIGRRNIIAGVAGLVLGAFLGFGLIIWTNRVSPIIIHEAKEVDGIATRDGHIDLYFEFDRTRDCPSETSRWLWTWVDHNGMRIKQFYPLLNTATTLTDVGRDQRFILTIPIPPGIWNGKWYYWSKTVEHCPILTGFFQSRIRESTDIPIQIVADARAGSP